MSEVEKTPEEKAQAEKARIVKAKSGGFAQGKAIEPAKKGATERLDQEFESKLDKISRLVTQSFEDAMAPTQPIKVRLDAANKLMTQLYRPTQTIKVEGDVNSTSVTFNVANVDGLSDKDRELLERAKRATQDEPEEIEGEVLEEDPDA